MEAATCPKWRRKGQMIFRGNSCIGLIILPTLQDKIPASGITLSHPMQESQYRVCFLCVQNDECSGNTVGHRKYVFILSVILIRK